MTDKPTIDRDRGAVYAAEDQVGRIMASRSRAVRLAGNVLVLPEPLAFGTLEGVERFVDAAARNPLTQARFPQCGPVLVTSKGGYRRAQYVARPTGGGLPQIQIPATDRRGSWALAQSVVLHEFAHHLAGVPGHGRSFRAALEHLYQVHLGAEAAQLLSTLLAPLAELPPVSDPAADDPALRRVGALLAKATATDSADEAQAYLAKANVLAARHSVDLAIAAMAGAGVQTTTPTHRMVTIGRPGEPLNKLLVSLFARLAATLGIRVDVGPRSCYVLAFGLTGDLDQLEAMYVTASAVMVEGADAHVRSGVWKGQTYGESWSGQPVHGSGSRPVTARVARTAFCIGFVDRVTTAKAASGSSAASPGSAAVPVGVTSEEVSLALRRKELVVSNYHRSASRARGSWRGSASGAGSAAASRRAGQRAGESFGRSKLAGPGRRQLGSS